MALHEIVCDAAGVPVDYRFLDVNRAFEAITGLERERVLGKTVLEVLPDLESYWIETYGEVALTGKGVRFDNYSSALDKHFQVSAFSPQKGQFAVVFYDITEQKKTEDALKKREMNSEQLTKQLRESQMLFEISQMLAGTMDLSATLQQIAVAANTLIRSADRTILHLLDEDERYLRAAAVSGSRPERCQRAGLVVAARYGSAPALPMHRWPDCGE